MKRSTEVISEVKNICLELLLEVDRICRKNGIRYFLYGGTLLGAVRHKGFIPWDDDIDLLFLREDYRQFVEICKLELGKEYFLETIESEALSLVTWGKLHKRGTAFIHDNVPRKCFQGISIDLFAMDKVPANRFRRWLFGYFHDTVNFIYAQRFSRREKAPSFRRRITHLLVDITKVVPDAVFKRWYQSYSCKYNDSHSTYGIHNSFRKFNKKIMPLSFFEETCLLEFEGHHLPAPKQWHELLKLYYGENYMDLPPESERFIHHASVVDPYQSWEKYDEWGIRSECQG